MSHLPSWLATGPALEPIDDPYDIHRRGIQGLLEVGVGQSDIATLSQIKATHALRQGALRAGSQGIPGFKLRRLLALPCGLQRHMLLVGPDGQLPRCLIGPGAGATDRAGPTRRGVKANAHDRTASHIMARGPFDARMALGTPCLLRRPIQHKGIDTIALTGALLTTIGAKRRPEHIDLMQALGTGQEVSIDIATVEEMRAWQEIPLG